MKTGTMIGILIGAAAILGSFIWEGGSFDALIIGPAMVIVFVGTLAAGTAGTSFEQLAKMPMLIGVAFFPKQYDLEKTINQIVTFSAIARKNGILTLESRLKSVEHPMMKKMIELCIDGTEPDTLEKIVEAEVGHITERHGANINFFKKLGGYSPTMGIIGTVMGLISTLASAGEDPTVLIRHIATAFIATMWGIFMANIVWLPIGDKLQTLHDEEMRLFQVILDGVYALQVGETPSVIRAKLAGALPLSEQESSMEKSKNLYMSEISKAVKKENVPPGISPDKNAPSASK